MCISRTAGNPCPHATQALTNTRGGGGDINWTTTQAPATVRRPTADSAEQPGQHPSCPPIESSVFKSESEVSPLHMGCTSWCVVGKNCTPQKPTAAQTEVR